MLNRSHKLDVTVGLLPAATALLQAQGRLHKKILSPTIKIKTMPDWKYIQHNFICNARFWTLQCDLLFLT